MTAPPRPIGMCVQVLPGVGKFDNGYPWGQAGAWTYPYPAAYPLRRAPYCSSRMATFGSIQFRGPTNFRRTLPSRSSR
jgi:hypothetical protein